MIWGVPPFSETSIYPEQLGALFSLLRYSTLKPRRFHAIGANLLDLFNLTFFDSKSVSLNTFLSNLGKLYTTIPKPGILGGGIPYFSPQFKVFPTDGSLGLDRYIQFAQQKKRKMKKN